MVKQLTGTAYVFSPKNRHRLHNLLYISCDVGFFIRSLAPYRLPDDDSPGAVVPTIDRQMYFGSGFGCSGGNAVSIGSR